MDALARQTAALGDDDALRALLREVCRETGMGFAALARVTDTRWIACQVEDQIEFGLLPGAELELKTTICDDIRRCGEAIVIDNTDADIQWRTHATPILYGFKSYASFPVILDDGRFFGTLCAIDPAPRPLNRPDLVLLLVRAAREAARIITGRELASVVR